MASLILEFVSHPNHTAPLLTMRMLASGLRGMTYGWKLQLFQLPGKVPMLYYSTNQNLSHEELKRKFDIAKCDTVRISNQRPSLNDIRKYALKTFTLDDDDTVIV
jgi:hypothetical protein